MSGAVTPPTYPQDVVAQNLTQLDKLIREHKLERAKWASLCNHDDYGASDEHYYCNRCDDYLGDVFPNMFQWIPKPGMYLKRCPRCKGQPGVVPEGVTDEGVIYLVPCPDCGSTGYGSVPPGWLISKTVYVPGEDK